MHVPNEQLLKPFTPFRCPANPRQTAHISQIRPHAIFPESLTPTVLQLQHVHKRRQSQPMHTEQCSGRPIIAASVIRTTAKLSTTARTQVTRDTQRTAFMHRAPLTRRSTQKLHSQRDFTKSVKSGSHDDADEDVLEVNYEPAVFISRMQQLHSGSRVTHVESGECVSPKVLIQDTYQSK